ncbi:MAG TPA: FlgD immunoglobulin-like domain containing protein [Candidatus Eisenbacteria bacterium]
MAGTCFLFLFVLASPALAALKGISIAPPEPTTCDPVSITVAGELPDDCYEIVGAVIRGPEEIPCMRPGPCPFRYWVEITVREPDPARTCPAVISPYTRSFDVGRLRFGEYGVVARERVIPFAADSTDSTVSETFANATFTVRPDSVCTPGPGCYILGFGPDRIRDPLPGTFCTAVAPPGGTACLALTLMNTHAVGGLQTTLAVYDPDGGEPADGALIHAVSVEPVGRAAGFQVGWTAEGAQTRIILYSTTPGASIPPGDGPVVRICYSIAPETPPQTFRVLDLATIVADPAGEAIPACPTLQPVADGFICVTSSSGCDVNGDGVSDVLDVIRLVRCALATSSDSGAVCPDSVAARADCNGDGSIDIRDVICCVRKIVGIQGGAPGLTLPPAIGAVPAGENSIGFEGAPRWTSAVEGVATVRVDAAENWGGTQFVLNPQGAPARIRGLSLEAANAREGTQLEWAIDELGIARVMLYEVGSGARSAHSYRILVLLERVPSGASGTVRIQSLRAGTSEGAAAGISSFNPSVQVDAATVAAPALLGARPNPSAGQTEIGFVLPADARVTLRVYDVAGRLVRTLIDGPMPAGVHRARWDGTDDRGRAARSGIYFTTTKVGAKILSERIMLLR